MVVAPCKFVLVLVLLLLSSSIEPPMRTKRPQHGRQIGSILIHNAVVCKGAMEIEIKKLMKLIMDLTKRKPFPPPALQAGMCESSLDVLRNVVE